MTPGWESWRAALTYALVRSHETKTRMRVYGFRFRGGWRYAYRFEEQS